MTEQTTAPTREAIIQTADEWLLNDPESNLFSIPREIVVTAFDAPRRKTECGEQETWDGCAHMRFCDLLTHVGEVIPGMPPNYKTLTFGEMLDRLVKVQVKFALIMADNKLRHRPWTLERHPLSDDHRMIEERTACWRERLLSVYRAMPLAKVLEVEPNRWGFYLYRPQGDKVVGDIYEVTDAERIEKLLLSYTESAQAIVEFHAETSPDMKAVEGIDFDIHYLRASVTNDGALIARLDGYLLSWPKAIKHLKDGDFLSACDCISQELGEFAYYMLAEHDSAKKIFAKGAVFYLHHWEVAKDWRGRYMGWDMVRQTMEAIRRFEPTTGTVALDLAPLQYYYPLPRMAPDEIRQPYLVDRAHLIDYWKRIYAHRVFGPQSRTMHFGAAKQLTRDELTQAIASLNGQREHLSS